MKKVIVIVCLCFCTMAQAQILHPVKWAYGAKKVGNTETVIFLKANIQPGWHIYSAYQKDGGPVKTSIDITPSGDFELDGTISEPAPVTRFESAFNMNVSYFENEVIFQQKIRLKNSAALVKGTVRFMVCNDHQCLPPETVNFAIPVK